MSLTQPLFFILLFGVYFLMGFYLEKRKKEDKK